MNWDLYLEKFQDFLVTRSENPPALLLFVGLFIALTSGFAFAATLRLQVNDWYRNRTTYESGRWERLKVLIPFVGTFLGFWVFLGASFEVLGLSPFLAWVSAIILATLTGALSWTQIGKTLGQGVVRAYLDQTFHFSS